MAWGRMKCVACGHVFDAYVAELKDQRRMLGPVGAPIRHYGDLSHYTGRDPNPRCPECDVQQRMAFWPFIPLVCSLPLIWLTMMTLGIALLSDKIHVEVFAPLPWIAGGWFVVSLFYAIIAHSIAKPIRC